MLGIALSVIDVSIVNLALPGIARDLNATAAHSVWVVNAYQLGVLTLLLPLATLGDLVGYRRVYIGGLTLFTLSSVVCILAPSLAVLAGARAVQGMGAAGVMAVNTALVRLTYPRHLLGRGIAFNSVVVATASVAGPTLAAGVLSVASWPWLFAINIPLGMVVLFLAVRALPENASPPREGVRLSKLDVTLNILMFSLVFLGADALGTRGGPSGSGGSIVGSAPAGAAMLLAGAIIGWFYIRRQLSQAVPLFPVDLLRIPLFALSMCTSVTAFLAQTLSYVALPFLMLDGYGKSALETGLLLTAWPLSIVVVAPFAGRLIGRHHAGMLGGAGLAVMATGLALLALLPAHPVNADIAWRLALCGAGFGLFQSPNNHTIVTSAPMHRAGGASGMLGTARLTGQSIGAVMLAIIFSVSSAHDGRGPTIALGLAAAFAAMASVFSSLRVRH